MTAENHLPRSSPTVAHRVTALKRELAAEGYHHTHSVMSSSPSTGGIYFAHPDGRRAVIRPQPDLKIFYLSR